MYEQGHHLLPASHLPSLCYRSFFLGFAETGETKPNASLFSHWKSVSSSDQTVAFIQSPSPLPAALRESPWRKGRALRQPLISPLHVADIFEATATMSMNTRREELNKDSRVLSYVNLRAWVSSDINDILLTLGLFEVELFVEKKILWTLKWTSNYVTEDLRYFANKVVKLKYL